MGTHQVHAIEPDYIEDGHYFCGPEAVSIHHRRVGANPGGSHDQLRSGRVRMRGRWCGRVDEWMGGWEGGGTGL